MKNRSLRSSRAGFTLVELLVVLGIIALLAGLSAPAYTRMVQKANSMKCAANLRAIGIAANLAAADNGNKYLDIDQADSIIYSDADHNGHGPGILTALGPYGIIDAQVRCPVDMQQGANCSYQKYSAKWGPAWASSYEWNPTFDDEELNATAVYTTADAQVPPYPVASARVRLSQDFNALHRVNLAHGGWCNVLYGDGHVSSH